MSMFAVFQSQPQTLPVVMEVSSEEKFFELCESFSCSWAHLYNKDSGETVCSYSEDDVPWRNN